MYTVFLKPINRFACIMVFSLTGGLLNAQNTVCSDSAASVLHVLSDMDGLEICIDDESVGRTPLDSVRVTPGHHTIRVRHPNPLSWLNEDWVEQVDIRPGERMTLRVAFPRRVWVSSDPPGASVFMADQMLGRTPLSVVFLPAEPSALSLSLEGYRPFRLMLSDRTPSVLSLEFTRQIPDQMVDSELRLKRKSWMVTAGIVALIAGASGAYLRQRAERDYERYRKTADPERMESYFDSAARYDRLSGIFYGLGEVSLGFSLVLLIQEHSAR